MQNKSNCGINFQEYLKEQLKDTEFKKGYKKAGKRLQIENHFNDLLQTMGIKDMFVEVKDMSDY